MEVKSFKKEYMKPGQRIIIYGAGRYGELALRGLQQLGLDVECFADRKLAGKFYLGKRVVNPQELSEYTSDIILIATLNYFKEMKTYLQEINARHYFDIYELLMMDIPAEKLSEYAQDEKGNIEKYKNIITETNSGQFSIGHCELVVTEKCTLRCRDCANLIQYYPKPMNLNAEDIIQSFDCFLETIDVLSDLRILGGEPFVFKNLDIILSHYVDNSKIKRITINTNATIVPKEAVIDSLKNEKIVVHISDYKINREQVNNFERLLIKEKIRYYIHKYQEWNDIGKMELKSYSEDDLIRVYQSCAMAKCYTFYRNKFFVCPRAAHGMQLGFLPEEANEYVDFSVDHFDRVDKQIELKKLMDKMYIKACNYCRGSDIHRKGIPAAIQMKKQECEENG